MNFSLALMIVAIPAILPWLARIWFHHTVTWQEALTVTGVAVLMGFMIFGAGSYSQVHDTLIVNGKVSEKYRDRVSCSHSYSCRCRTVRTGKTTSRQCDTCYEHLFDYDWVVKTTVGRIEINRVDRQGTREPPRFTEVVIGEPASMQNGYINWIKGAPDSIFSLRHTLSQQHKHINYPETFDYYRVNRVINDGGVTAAQAEEINNKLNLALREIGPAKQMNTVYIFTNNPRDSYGEAIRQDWLGGKKNDAIVVWSRDKEGKTQWVKVFSWSKVNIYNVQLQDAYMNMTEFNPDNVVAEFVKASSSFKRRSMEEYEYLKYSVQPPTWVVVLCFLITLAVSIGGIVFSHQNDLYN